MNQTAGSSGPPPVIPTDPFLAADFDANGAVNTLDFNAFAAQWGKRSGRDTDYNPRYDLNQDGSVGFLDFLLFAKQFGKTAP